MLSLANHHLEVSVLDPNLDEDRQRFGTRYCTGGYIFQITDRRRGELLSGPTYPDSFNVFDGQGIPDAFSRCPLRNPEDPNTALIIGVGHCEISADRVITHCQWDVRSGETTITFRTRQSIGDITVNVQRRIELHARTVRSTTWLDNKGTVGFQVCWYPHPFFPQPEENELCRLNIPVSIRENDGYVLSPSGFIARRSWPWTTDYYLALDHDARSPLTVIQRHPKVGLVTGSCTYIPRFFPIWGNSNTFSWEPYLENTVAPGQEMAWAITYDF